MLKRFKNFNETIAPSEHDLRCSGCNRLFSAPLNVTEFICTDCENEGWWIDPAGGIHEPDNGDFEDPAAMYEKIYEKFYNESWHTSDKLKDHNDKTGLFQDGELITTVDKLMTWYGGGNTNWFEDVENTNTMSVDGEHAQESDAEGMDHLKYLFDHKDDKILVTVVNDQSTVFQCYILSFDVDGKEYEMDAVNKPFETT